MAPTWAVPGLFKSGPFKIFISIPSNIGYHSERKLCSLEFFIIMFAVITNTLKKHDRIHVMFLNFWINLNYDFKESFVLFFIGLSGTQCLTLLGVPVA